MLETFMITAPRRALVAGAFLLVPLALGAQRPDRQRRERAPRNSISALIDARRELDLTSRQLAQLDSIERSVESRNGAIAERLRAARDSQLTARRRSPAERMPRDSADRARRRELALADRDSMRGRLEALRPLREEIWRNDSTARAGAERILTDPQRQRLREIEIERRAEMRGRMLAMRDRMGARHGRGFDRGRGSVPRRFGRPDGMRRDFERRTERRGRMERFPDSPLGPRMRLRNRFESERRERMRPIRPAGPEVDAGL
jgi:hypothetical protein